MRRLLLALSLLLLALPASAAVLVDSVRVADAGICVDLRSTGAASVRVEVDGRPDMGFVKVHWNATGDESLTVTPLRPGEVARSEDRGVVAGMRSKTLWIPTKADEPLAFRVKIHEGATLVAEHAFADLPAGAACAAAP